MSTFIGTPLLDTTELQEKKQTAQHQQKLSEKSMTSLVLYTSYKTQFSDMRLKMTPNVLISEFFILRPIYLWDFEHLSHILTSNSLKNMWGKPQPGFSSYQLIGNFVCCHSQKWIHQKPIEEYIPHIPWGFWSIIVKHCHYNCVRTDLVGVCGIDINRWDDQFVDDILFMPKLSLKDFQGMIHPKFANPNLLWKLVKQMKGFCKKNPIIDANPFLLEPGPFSINPFK